MTYEWNPLWREPEGPENPAYVDTIRRMMMASINWFVDHPGKLPTWREMDQRKLARASGIADEVPLEKIAFIGNWEDFYVATNEPAKVWFKAIVDACGSEENAPSTHMFSKAVAAGQGFVQLGWDGFNAFMLQRDPEQAGH